MITHEEVHRLLTDLESARVERTQSTKDTEKFSKAVCAFANDLENSGKKGYLLIGVKDNGELSGLQVTDELLKDLAALRTNGQILPTPSIGVERFDFSNGEVAVVEVSPVPNPPVRYKGKVWIRVGPTATIASETDERRLMERRVSNARNFDMQPCLESELSDMSELLIRQAYLPNAIAPEVLLANGRDFPIQLASLRLFDKTRNCPTNAGVLLFGINHRYFFPGAYVQYLKLNGNSLSDEVLNSKEFHNPLAELPKQVEDFVRNNIIQETLSRGNGFQESVAYNYPLWAIRELMLNALMHRDYQSNAPIFFREFSDRIEIENPGGLYGDVNEHNFPKASDYRNPVLAEALKVLGYVNKFNYGIVNAQSELQKNGNPPAEFDLTSGTKFKVTVYAPKVSR
jgi:ATP-dependent DNA helicase RecG